MADISSNTVWFEVDASNSILFPEGMNPSAVDDSCRSVQGAVKRWYDRLNATATSTGAANIQNVNYSVAPSAYVAGDLYCFIPGFTNSSATVLNINSLGGISVLVAGLSLQGGEIVAGYPALVIHDGSNFQLLNPYARPGDLAVHGAITSTTLTTTGTITDGGDLHVAGNESLTGNLSVGGTGAFAGALSTASTLTVTGATILNNSLTLAGSTIDFNGGSNPVQFLTSGTTYYIATTGNDSTGDGSSGAPWKTLAHAYSTISAKTNFGNQTVTLILATGTYTSSSTAFNATTGNWEIHSASSNATDVTISVTGTSQDGIHASGNAVVTVRKVTIGAATGYAATAEGGAELFIDGVNFNASKSHIVAFDGGTIEVVSPYSINAGASDWHYLAEHGTLVASSFAVPVTVSSTGSVAFGQAFAGVADAGFIRAISGNYSGVTGTGVRYIATANGVIQTNGATDTTYFPGNSAGSTASGGQWV